VNRERDGKSHRGVVTRKNCASCSRALGAYRSHVVNGVLSVSAEPPVGLGERNVTQTPENYRLIFSLSSVWDVQLIGGGR
jgi:hypothetical protein